jgi:hypothetical protein
MYYVLPSCCAVESIGSARIVDTFAPRPTSACRQLRIDEKYIWLFEHLAAFNLNRNCRGLHRLRSLRLALVSERFGVQGAA